LTSSDAGSALAVSDYLIHGTHLDKLSGLPATRRRITTRVACVFEVRDGKLAHERPIRTREYLAPTGALRPRRGGGAAATSLRRSPSAPC
jgi:hypothetical protein